MNKYANVQIGVFEIRKHFKLHLEGSCPSCGSPANPPSVTTTYLCIFLHSVLYNIKYTTYNK